MYKTKIILDTDIKPGELTEFGLHTANRKGREFSSRYQGLLSYEEEDYNNIKNEIKAFCSKKRRNIISLFMKLKGIYTNMKFPNISLDEENIKKILSENFNTEFPNDLMFNVLENLNCRAKIEKILKDSPSLEQIKHRVARMTDSSRDIFWAYFTELPKEMHIYLKVFYIADYLERHMENRVEINDKEQDLKDLLTNYYKLIVDTTAEDPSIFRLFTTKIYEKILKEFEAKVNGRNQFKLILFSAHDVTMSAFIHSIHANVRDYHYEFNDEINFVLYEVEDEYYVSIKYNNEEIPLKFCGGKKICGYKIFKTFIEESISKDEDIENFCEGKLDVLTNSEKEIEINLLGNTQGDKDEGKDKKVDF